MAILDSILSSVGEKLGIPGAAGPLLSWLLSFMTDPKSGGIGGFVDRLKKAGLGNEVSQILSGNTKMSLNPGQVESLLGGKSVVSSLASKIGVPESAAAAAAGMAIPRLLGALTPGGKIPDRLPTEIDDFIRTSAVRIAEPGRREPEPVRVEHHREPERRVTTTQRAPEPTNDWWKWLLPLLALGALGLWAVRSCAPPEEPVPAPAPAPVRPVEPVATPPIEPAPIVREPVIDPAPALEPGVGVVEPRLEIVREAEGRVRVSGVVGSEAGRDSLITALTNAFGDGKVITDNITVNPDLPAAAWADKLVDVLKILAENPEANVTMAGDRVSLGENLPAVSRTALLDALRAVLGDNFKFE